MKKVVLLTLVYLSFLFTNAKTQIISPDLLGDWSFQYELNSCGSIIESGCDMEGLSISQYNNNAELDTLLITEYKESNESYPARYEMTVNTSEPNDRYVFTNLDSTTEINLFLFLSTYDSDSLIFNWTTTDPGVFKNFELISEDSLIFHWDAGCNACHCGGTIHFARIQTTSNPSLVSNSGAWTIYPNPAREYISLEKKETENNKKTTISIIDSKGIIYQKIVTSEYNLRLPVENLDTGLYYIKFENDRKMRIKKFVIID